MKNNYDNLTERYRNDPHFNAMVKLFYNQLEQGLTSPAEIRQAAMYAQIMFEQLRPPRPIMIDGTIWEPK